MQMIHAELKIDNCRAELWLNDIPLQLLAQNLSHNVSIPAHLYLVDGVNSLEIVVNPGPIPSHARQPFFEATLSGSAVARLVAYEARRFTGESGQVLLETSFDGSSAAPGPYPRSAKSKANLGSMFGRWDWESAEPLLLDTPTIESLAQVLESIRESLATGNPEVMLRFASGKLANAARAFPARSFEILVGQFRRIVQRDSATAGWTFPALDHEQFDFRLVSGGRLIECINRDWKPTLRTEVRPDGYPKSYALVFCRIGGQWRIAF